MDTLRFFMSLRNVGTQSLPCAKGGGTAQAVTEGLQGIDNDNPPVRNQRFLPASFTQGGLWRGVEGAAPYKCEKEKDIL